ncbi:hypothetical protein ACHAXT_000266 [Thalassiosira profunda]
MAPLRLCLVWPMCLALALPMASSQPPLPNSQCVAAPCTYVGECRDRSGVCGDTVMHCNANSIWVPACGGGGGLVKPAPTVSSPSPPTNRPIVQPQPQTTPEPPTDALTSFNEEPSSRPTTNWEGWLAKSDPANQGVVGLTTGKEGEEEYVASNATGGFNPDSWGYREEGGEGWLDGIGFLNNAANERTWTLIFLASAAAVGAALS